MVRRRFLASVICAAAITAATCQAEPGVSDAEIRIGQSAVFTGPSASLGIEMRDGIQAHLRYINQSGGVNGRQIKLTALDDGYEPARAAANTRALINENGVFALIGYVGTPTSNAAYPIFTEGKVPFIGPFTGASSLRSPFNRYIFNIRASYADEADRMVESMKMFGADRIALFTQADAYGEAVKAATIRAMSKIKVQPIAMATVERNSLDVSKAVDIIERSNANSVIMGSVYSASAALVQELRRRNKRLFFASVSFIGTNSLFDHMKGDAAGIGISQVMPSPFSAGTPLQREYRDAMNASGTPTLSYGSMEGYVAAKIFTEALRKAGKLPTRERLIESLESFSPIDIKGYAVSFSPTNHNGSSFTEMTVLGANRTLKH